MKQLIYPCDFVFLRYGLENFNKWEIRSIYWQ